MNTNKIVRWRNWIDAEDYNHREITSKVFERVVYRFESCPDYSSPKAIFRNVLQIGDVADFETLNRMKALNLI